MPLVNRSAIWYVRELNASCERGDLTTSGALYLLFQNKLVIERTRAAIRASFDAWEKDSIPSEVLQQFAASGRWWNWIRLLALTALFRAFLAWLRYGPPLWEHAAIRKLLNTSERIAQVSVEQLKPSR